MFSLNDEGNLVERLRAGIGTKAFSLNDALYEEAADYIEALEEEINRLKAGKT